MAWGAILGSLLSAGGQVAGGIIGQQGQMKPSDATTSYYNPALDYAFRASEYDRLNQLGWGDINMVPTPIQRLIGQFQNVPMDVKSRRRAIDALNNIRENPSFLTDPTGQNLTPEEMETLKRTGSLPGRFKYNEDFDFMTGSPRDREGIINNRGVPIKGLGRLEQALGGAGLNFKDLVDVFDQQRQYDAQIAKLKEAGIGQMNTDAILGRYKAASEAAKLAGGAADFIRSGNASTDPTMSLLKQQDDYSMAQAQEKLGLMANFGGMNQASVMSALANMQNTQNPRLVERALTLSGALGGSLAGGVAANANAGNAGMNSAQLAAQQASALNSLRASTSDARATSLANGIASGAGAIGSDLSNYAMLQSNRAYQQQQTEANNKAMLDMIKSLQS